MTDKEKLQLATEHIEEIEAKNETLGSRLEEIASIADPDGYEERKDLERRLDRMETRQDRIESLLAGILEHMKIKQEAA